MRKLTDSEKAQSLDARKRANKALEGRRKELRKELDNRQPGTARYSAVLEKLFSLIDVKGLPVVVELGDERIALNYEMFQRMVRKIKGRQLDVYISPYIPRRLIISHSAPGSAGTVELLELPERHRELLGDLPIISLN